MKSRGRAIEPIAAQRKRSDGSFAVCCSIDFATDPSACSLLLTDDMAMNELLFRFQLSIAMSLGVRSGSTASSAERAPSSPLQCGAFWTGWLSGTWRDDRVRVGGTP